MRMKTNFEYLDYRELLKDYISSFKKKGLQAAMAKAAGISSSMMSLILKSEKQLSMEQACELGEYLGFNDNEFDYFLMLVEFDRAGSSKLKNRLLDKIKTKQKKFKDVSSRVNKAKDLSVSAKSIYYSHWTYTGIRNLCAIDTINTNLDISEYLNINQNVINEVIEFLLQNQLLVLNKNKLEVGSANTFISKKSPFIITHHKNWRVKAFEMMKDHNKDENLFFTSPMSLSHDALEQLKFLLLETIEKAVATVGPSESETVACLNIDLFKY